MRMPWELEWDLEPPCTELARPLVINVAPGQMMTMRGQNPNLAYSPREIADQAAGSTRPPSARNAESRPRPSRRRPIATPAQAREILGLQALPVSAAVLRREYA